MPPAPGPSPRASPEGVTAQTWVAVRGFGEGGQFPGTVFLTLLRPMAANEEGEDVVS